MSREATLEHLRAVIPVVAPSLLKCDFGNLHREIELLHAAGAQLLHLDVMDGHFVDNLSYGPVVIECLREITELPLDAHLMISEPEKYLDAFLDAGCDCLTVHAEAVPNPAALLRRIRQSDAVSGLAINPNTTVETIADALPECDLVLVMSVEPGFGGQSFIASSLDKLQQLRQLVEPGTFLSIDGGIGPATIADAAGAGADILVAGSAVFDQSDYRESIEELTKLAATA